MTVGPAAVPVGVLRKLPAGFVADTFDLLGGLLGEMNVTGQSRSAKTDSANQDEKSGRISHGTLH